MISCHLCDLGRYVIYSTPTQVLFQSFATAPALPIKAVSPSILPRLDATTNSSRRALCCVTQKRFCGLTLDKPIATVQQRLLDDWTQWAKNQREKHLAWREQAKATEQQSQQQSSKSSKKGKSKGARRAPPMPAPVTAEDNVE